ncbi:MAG TPA: choice-of-anchor tandem repeat GloVer-containing protein, partial [Methylocystis sp.]|nr:choice-of-anchor tandem repeat GloVer-containing protein [Methylocystis sp.]
GAAETQGSKGWGVVYKLAPPTSGQTLWTESDLHEFTGESDGGFPVGPIVIGTNGALYGVTAAGGGPLGAGTIYELKPPAAGKTKWTFSTLYKFQVASDGATPLGGVIFGAKGALFGTTSAGGSNGAGLVFELQ